MTMQPNGFITHKLHEIELGKEVVDIVVFKKTINPDPREFKAHKLVIDESGLTMHYTEPKNANIFFEDNKDVANKLLHQLKKEAVVAPITEKQIENLCEKLEVKADVFANKKEFRDVDSAGRLQTTPFKLSEKVRLDGFGNENGIVKTIRQGIKHTVGKTDFILTYIVFFVVLDKEKKWRSSANTTIDETMEFLNSLAI